MSVSLGLHRVVYRPSLVVAGGLLNGVSQALRLLPERARYAPSDTLVRALRPALAPTRKTAERNFAIMLGRAADDPKVKQLAAASLRNFGRMASDFLRVRTMTPPEVLRWGSAAGEDHLAAALAQGKGAIFALAHFGSWDVAAAYAQAYGLRLTIVTESDWTSELVASSRISRGITLAPRDRALRLALKALSRGETVAIITDIVRPGFQAVDVPFFGHPTPFPLGPARIAIKTGAPVLITAGLRLSDGRYRIEAQPALQADSRLAPDEGARQLTAAIAARLERLIAAYPEQWYPFRPMWPQVDLDRIPAVPRPEFELPARVPVVQDPVEQRPAIHPGPTGRVIRQRGSQAAGE
jgi:KDO2-lipid IV(A) lauroyltransferase